MGYTRHNTTQEHNMTTVNPTMVIMMHSDVIMKMNLGPLQDEIEMK